MFFFNTLVNFQREWQGYVWEEFASKADQKNAKEHGRQKENHLMTCFVGDTSVLTREGDVPISDVRAGDYVATRNGFRKVVAAGLTRRCAKVVRAVFSDGREIVCTPDHRFYVPKEDRFLPLTDIPYLTQVCTADSVGAWKQQVIRAKHTEDIPIRAGVRTGFISNVLENTCTGLCGRTITAASRRVATFIIKMGIRLITALKTLNVLHQGNMHTSIQSGLGLNLDNMRKSVVRPSKSTHGRSEGRKLVDATLRRLKKFFVTDVFPKTSDAWFAGSPLLIGLSISGVNAVQTDAMQSCGETPGWMTRSGSALSAQQPLSSTSIKKQEPVHLVALRDGGIADVYDIQVESDHEFFANGILVHNCLFYLAQIPMRYLGAYGEGKVLTGERTADKSAGVGSVVSAPRRRSSVTGY